MKLIGYDSIFGDLREAWTDDERWHEINHIKSEIRSPINNAIEEIEEAHTTLYQSGYNDQAKELDEIIQLLKDFINYL